MDALEQVAEEVNMSPDDVAERLITWLDGESELVQQAVLGQYPRSVADQLAKLIIKRRNVGAAKPGSRQRKSSKKSH
jgi:hypothetical protein